MAQVVEMEVRDHDLLAGLPPADCAIEVTAMPRLTVLIDKNPHVRAVERVGVQVVLEFRQNGGRRRPCGFRPSISAVLAEGRQAW